MCYVLSLLFKSTHILTVVFIFQFDLVCDKNGLIQVSQSLYMAGFLISTLVFGSISDR